MNPLEFAIAFLMGALVASLLILFIASRDDAGDDPGPDAGPLTPSPHPQDPQGLPDLPSREELLLRSFERMEAHLCNRDALLRNSGRVDRWN